MFSSGKTSPKNSPTTKDLRDRIDALAQYEMHKVAMVRLILATIRRINIREFKTLLTALRFVIAMVHRDLAKVQTRVRFPSPAPYTKRKNPDHRVRVFFVF